MFRKTVIAIAATAALATALPTTASAKHWKGWRGVGIGVGIGLGMVGAGYAASCYRYELVKTRYGWREVLVNVCGGPYYPY
jgi:hypothetical protein